MLDNPFFLLKAQLYDGRDQIMDLADDQSFVLGEKMVADASAILTHPRKRLEAEIGWLLGVDAVRINKLLELLQENPRKLFNVRDIPELARANLLASGLIRYSELLSSAECEKWIGMIANLCAKLDAPGIAKLVNMHRKDSGFKLLSNMQAVEEEWHKHVQYYRTTIKISLQEHNDRNDIICRVVETTTAMGHKQAPALVDDLVDAYAVDNHEHLKEGIQRIRELATKIEQTANVSHARSLSKQVDEFICEFKEWDRVAQPIQLSTKSRGMDHPESVEAAVIARHLSVWLVNEHGQVELAQKINQMIKEVFAEVVTVSEKAQDDSSELDEIAKSKILDEVFAVCLDAMQKSDKNPHLAINYVNDLLKQTNKLLLKISKSQDTRAKLNEINDVIGMALMRCAIAYANETKQWEHCVPVLKKALAYATNEKILGAIKQNLLIAMSNSAAESPKESWIENGFRVLINFAILIVFITIVVSILQ